MYNQYGFTLYGVNNYFELTEEPLFQNIELFQGGTVFNNEWEDGQVIPAIDKNVLINQIMEDNGDLLCFRQIPDQFKRNVNMFFKSYYQQFKVVWIALNMNYNPIDNYDRHEYILDEYNSNNKRTDKTHYKDTNDLEKLGTETSTNTPSGKDFNKITYTGKEIQTNMISADNATGFQNDTKTELEKPTLEQHENSFENRQTTDVLSFGNRKDKGTFEHIYLDGYDLNEHLGEDTTKIWAHGNVGTTMTSQIIKNEIELRQFNFYEWVSRLFSKKLLLEIY